jgi:hypothetical protein
MSDGYGYGSAAPTQPDAHDDTGKVDAAKQEASAVKDTATDAAKDVAHTATQEAAAVAGEVKSQLADLYAQSRNELSDQASQQQARIASGLASVGDDLSAMARGSENEGIAADLVQQVSTRLSSAAAWLEARDPAAVLEDVKRFARRRPVLFIAGAAVAGIVAGRLVRALAAVQHDDSSRSLPTSSSPDRDTATAGAPSLERSGGAFEDTPLYAESAATYNTGRREDADERPDSL